MAHGSLTDYPPSGFGGRSAGHLHRLGVASILEGVFEGMQTMSKMREPDWGFWKLMPEVAQWKACALAVNIDPIQMEENSTALRQSVDSLPGYFQTENVTQQYNKLMELLKVHRFDEVHFTQNRKVDVILSEFAAWCLHISWPDLPGELKAMAKTRTQAAPAATIPVSTHSHVPADVEPNHDKTLAALFDPVTVEALEKMFPAEGKWKAWAEKAASNGLKDAAKVERARFNPYKAAVWFIGKGIAGWDRARCNRVLHKNLPARSVDDAHLLDVGKD